MTNEQYEQLRQVIIKANPDIVELGFGCKTDYGIITKIKGIELRLDGGRGYVSKGQVKRGLVKIIGRDIKLADVLIALNNAQKERDCDYLTQARPSYDNLNEIILINFKRDGNCSWNLKNNSLDWHWINQKETVDFLFNLICK